MALLSSSVHEIGAGQVGQTTFNISYTGPGIGYLLRTHIYLYINDAQTGGAGGVDPDGFTFVSDNQVTLKTYSPVLDDKIEFRRIMPKGSAFIDLVDGGGLRESVLDDIHNGLLYVSHEIYDGFSSAESTLQAIIDAAESDIAVQVAAAAASAAAALVSETNSATSEANAATSETNAATSETNASDSASAAAASAAGVDLPSIVAGDKGKMLLVNDAETGWQSDSVPTGRKNALINGNFDIWQRGDGPFTVDGQLTADRWKGQGFGSTFVCTKQSFILGQSDVPNEPRYFYRTVVTSAAGAGNFVVPTYRVPGVRTLVNKDYTLSFWAKADAPLNIATEFLQRFGSGGSPSGQVTGIDVTTHALTTSWQKFTVVGSIPSISGKSVGTDGNDALAIQFWFDAGSDFNARTNSLGQQSGTFDIAQVQIEAGTVGTSFDTRTLQQELRDCQRYFARLTSNNAFAPFTTGTSINTSQINTLLWYPTKMRAVPSVSMSPAANFLLEPVGGVPSGVTAIDVTPDRCLIRATAPTASAGLAVILKSNGSTATYIQMDAEI